MSVFVVLRLWVKSKQWWTEFGRTEVRGTTTWTIARHDGPKHLVL